jgi:hypothetical protein
MEAERKTGQEEEEDENEFDKMLGHCVKHQGVHSKRRQSIDTIIKFIHHSLGVNYNGLIYFELPSKE